MSGRVFLIGAGPGDPGLLTLKGLECLRRADVVAYDQRVPRGVLAYARSGAELIDVGTGGAQEQAPRAISYLLADKVREGKTVAHVLWGDPFQAGPGAEEALYLSQQGIAFELVPGVPAATAVSAYAGIPLTYPGGSDAVTVIRSHEHESRSLPDLDWSSAAKLGGTLVCHAGPHQLGPLLSMLLERGWSPDTRAAVIHDGTLPGQVTVEGTLAELRDGAASDLRRDAAMVVVGRVVGLREHLRWYDSRPLSGRRVLVTRPRDQAAELVEPLHALGAETIEAPMIRILPPEDPAPLARAAAEPDAFDWIVFTSGNAVDAFMGALLSGDRDVRALGATKICTVGAGTAQRLARYGIKVDLLPDEQRAEGVVAALATHATLDGALVLLPRADIGRELIAEQLRAAGSVVTDVVAYRTVPADAPREGEPDVYRLLLDGRIDVVTFTSPSAVRNFSTLYGADQVSDLLTHTAVAVIGPVTAEAATQLGIPVAIQPAVFSINGLVEAIATHFRPS